MRAAAYNYNDLWAIWGDPIKVPLPHISGSDSAGVVVEAGSDVVKLKVGDRVVSHSNMSSESATCAHLAENMIVMTGLSGVFKQDLYGEASVNIVISQK